MPALPAPAALIDLPQGFNVSGVTSWAWRVARALAARGHPVGIIRHAEPPGAAALDLDWPPGTRMFDATTRPPLDAARGDLSPWAEFHDAAVRAMAAEAPSLPVVCMPQLLGDSVSLFIPAVVEGRARLVLTNHSGIAYNDAIARHAAPMASAFIGVSEPVTGRWREALPARERDVRCIPNATDAPDTLPPRPPLRARPLRLIYSGRLVHEPKRVLALGSLSRALAERGVAHEITVIGDGPARRDLRGLVDAGAPLHLLDAMLPTALVEFLRAHDVVVLPSRYEGLSLALLEAMAQGCVPLVPRALAVAGLLDADATAVAADIDPDADAERTGRALGDALTARLSCLPRLSGGAWRRVREDFGMERFGARWSAVVHHAARSPARRWPEGRPIAFSTPGHGTVPPDARERTRHALAQLAGRRVAIHGTGRHTAEVADEFARSPAPIACYVDDDPERVGGVCLGAPIVTIERAAALGVTDALISSWINQEEIAGRAREYARVGIALHRIYPRPSTSRMASSSPGNSKVNPSAISRVGTQNRS